MNYEAPQEDAENVANRQKSVPQGLNRLRKSQLSVEGYGL